ncbi:MAG: Lrp/AsnC family transcriptional regulator [Candidatus Aenigmatarchaeota archaeon]
MEVKLDDWDRKILYELDKDASISLSNLSRTIRRSKEFVAYRIKKLEEGKVINGYTAIVDMSRLGFFTFRVYLRFQDTDDAKIMEMVEYLKKEDRVWTVAKLHGKWDYAFFVGVKKIPEFHKIWKGFLLNFKKNIKESKIALYSPIHNFNKRFFMQKGAKITERTTGVSIEEKADELDLAIINIWGADVRQSLKDVAKKLKTTPNTVANRIKILRKKKIIVGCKVDMDQSRMGYQGYRLDLYLNSNERREELFDYCKNLYNIYQINDSIGGADLELEVIVKDMDELLKMMNDMIIAFKGVINSYEYFSFFVFPKLTIVPD